MTRASLVDALQLDLIGPTGPLGDPRETLPQTPSRWYLTGFLVPTDADEEQRVDPTSNDELDQAAEPAGLDDDETPEKPAARRSYLPSSMGLSVLVPAEVRELQAVVRYGEYLRVEQEEGYSGPQQWRRIPREEIVSVNVGGKVGNGTAAVPNSRGVELVWSIRGVPDGEMDGGLPKGTRSLSVFVVNRRKGAPDEFVMKVLSFRSSSKFRATSRLWLVRTCGVLKAMIGTSGWPIFNIAMHLNSRWDTVFRPSRSSKTASARRCGHAGCRRPR